METRSTPLKTPPLLVSVLEKLKTPSTAEAGMKVLKMHFSNLKTPLAEKLTHMAILLESKEGEKAAPQLLSILPSVSDCCAQMTLLPAPLDSLPPETLAKLIDFLKPGVALLQKFYSMLSRVYNLRKNISGQLLFQKRLLLLGNLSVYQQYLSHVNLGFTAVNLVHETELTDLQKENEIFCHFRDARKLEEKALATQSASVAEKNKLMLHLMAEFRKAAAADSLQVSIIFLEAARLFEPQNPLVIEAMKDFIDVTIKRLKRGVVSGERMLVICDWVPTCPALKDKVSELAAAMEKLPETSFALNEKAEAFSYLGQYEKAVVWGEADIQKNGKSAERLLFLGSSYARLSNYEQACHHLLLVLEQEDVAKDTLEQALSSLCMVYNNMGRPRDAIKYAESHLALVPGDIHVTMIMAKAYLALREPEKAKTLVAEARPISLQDQALVEEVRLILFPKNRHLESKMSDNTNQAIVKIRLLLKRKKVAEAKELALQLMDSDEKDIMVRQQLADVFFAAEEYGKALEQYQAIVTESNRATFSIELMRIYYALDRYQDAQNEAWYFLSQADSKSSAQIAWRIYAYKCLLSCYLYTDRCDEGIQRFSKALEAKDLSDKEKQFVHAALARCHFFQNKHDGVKFHADEALRISSAEVPSDLYIVLGFFYFYTSPKQLPLAIENLHKANKAEPRDAEIILHLGLAYFHLGDKKDEALRWLSRALDFNPFYAFKLEKELPADLMQELLPAAKDSEPSKSPETPELPKAAPVVAAITETKAESVLEEVKTDRLPKSQPPVFTHHQLMHQWHLAQKRNRLQEMEQGQEEKAEDKSAEAAEGWRLSDTLFVTRSSKGVQKLAFRNRDPGLSHWYGMIDEKALGSQCDADFLRECQDLLSKGELTVHNGVGVRLLDARERATTKTELGKKYHAKLRFFSEHRGARVYGEKFESENGKETLVCFNKVQWKHL